MKRKDDQQDILERVRHSLSREVPEVLHQKMKAMLAGFRQDLAAHPSLHRRNRPTRPGWRRIFSDTPVWGRLALMGGTGLICVAVLMAIVLVDRTPSWAEVEKRFGDIEFCSVSAYVRDNPFGRPVFAQYWFGREGRARIHVDQAVVFINKGHPVQVFDIKTRGKGYPNIAMKGFLRAFEKARTQGSPTLISIMEALAGEGLVNTTDLLISDAQVAKDLLVFDARSRDTLWWLRVWALRESKLPIRILKWHRKQGRHIELNFTYSSEQVPAFFDAQAFARQLKDPSNDDHRLMNMFLQDPGEQAFPAPDS